MRPIRKPDGAKLNLFLSGTVKQIAMDTARLDNLSVSDYITALILAAERGRQELRQIVAESANSPLDKKALAAVVAAPLTRVPNATPNPEIAPPKSSFPRGKVTKKTGQNRRPA